MNATIEKVFPNAREWNSPKAPDGCSVEGVFQDGTRFEMATKTGKASEHIAALQALVGKPGEFDLEEREFNGQKQFRMKSYPGKPDSGKGYGGSKQYVPAWHQTEDGARYHEERTDRRTSLMQAVEYSADDASMDETLAVANKMYEWLRSVDQKPIQTAPVTQREAIAGEPMRETAQVQTPGVRPINEGPDKCACGAPVGKPHATKCEVN